MTATNKDIFDVYLDETELEEGCSAREMLDDLIHLVSQSARNLSLCHSSFCGTDPDVVKTETGQLRIAVGGLCRILREYESEKSDATLEKMKSGRKKPIAA